MGKEGTKACTLCKKEKPLSAFASRKEAADGRRSGCRECLNKKRKHYYRANPEKEKFRHVWDHYGIGQEEYERLLRRQSGVCAICGEPETTRHKGRLRYLAVDHDHKTGRIRGLLCFRCNTAIGKLGDDARLVYAAFRYLTFWRETSKINTK